MINTPSSTLTQPAPDALKVAFLCHSDNLGGASVVTRRLMHALREQGVDARMIVFNKLSEDPSVLPTVSRFQRGVTFMLERMRIAMANGFSRANLFKVSIANTGHNLHSHPFVQEADVIVLTWINQGMISLKEVRRLSQLGKPIVWIMHDMWNLTGICHHAMECKRYEMKCGCCPLLHSDSPTDLSNKVWRRKKALYDDVPITFVAVSNWLAECARKSSLLRNRDVRVIPNAFPIESFSTQSSLMLSQIPDGANVILFGAARLDDPIKGLGYAISALNNIFDNNPEIARSSVALFFGSIRDKSVFDRLRFPYQHLGTINDGRILRELYARADVVLSTSLYETLPGTLIEGQAAGCLPVTFGRGGQADIVDHLETGYIAKYKDSADVAEGIKWALAKHADREQLHATVRERFASSAVAQRFVDLFNELLAKKS